MKSGKDIARETGFSLSTVTKVLRGHSRKYNISRETEKRILDCASSLGYCRNEAAVITSTGINRTVAVLLDSKNMEVNVGVNEVLAGILREAADHSYGINTAMDDDLPAVFSRIAGSRVLHVVSFSLDRKKRLETAELCRKYGLSLIFIHENGAGGFPAVNTANREAMRQVTASFLSAGHRKIALLCTRHKYMYAAERHRGFLDAFEEAGMEPDRSLIFCRAISDRAAFAKRILALPAKTRPTAFLSVGEDSLILLMNSFLSQGAKVPEDFSFFGFGSGRTRVRSAFVRRGGSRKNRKMRPPAPSRKNGAFFSRRDRDIQDHAETHSQKINMRNLLKNNKTRRTEMTERTEQTPDPLCMTKFAKRCFSLMEPVVNRTCEKRCFNVA